MPTATDRKTIVLNRLARERREREAAMTALRGALDEVLSGPGMPRNETANALDYALDARGFAVRKIR